jgi:hypothetical protein
MEVFVRVVRVVAIVVLGDRASEVMCLVETVLRKISRTLTRFFSITEYVLGLKHAVQFWMFV